MYSVNTVGRVALHPELVLRLVPLHPEDIITATFDFV